MVAATHTHRSGALVRCGVVEADADYQDRVAAAARVHPGGEAPPL
jgi:hypothetical protein